MINLKKIILFLLLLLFFFPLLQRKTGFFKIKPLNGFFEIAKKPTLSQLSWFSGAYQDSMSTYINQNIGFRPLLIRINNQIDYSIFNYTKAPGVVIGKDGYLFIESYIIDYIGRNFIGKNKIEKEVKKLEEISDYLNQKNITLLVVFSPGKASFYPEYIPDYYLKEKKGPSNYNYYAEVFKKSNIHFIDFNDYFIKLKSKVAYPVYSKEGTHWSSFAQCVAIDSISKYIEYLKNIDLPEIYWHDITMSDSLNSTDMDIEELMNLMWPLKHEPMPYPNFKYNEINKSKPQLIAIADSYWWCLVGNDIPEHLFAQDKYWFYCKDIHINNAKQHESVDNIDFKKEILSQNIILLMATEATLHLFPYGFSQKFDEKIIENSIYTNLSLNEKLKYWINKINSDPVWLEKIKTKAKEKQISVDEMIQIDAKYMVDTN